MDAKTLRNVVADFVVDWMRQQVQVGRTTTELDHELGLKSHASISQYLNPAHPAKPGPDVVQTAATLLFGGSVDALKAAAINWHEERQRSRPQLPELFRAALYDLMQKHGRDFTDEAHEFYAFRHQNPEGFASAEVLGAAIYEHAQASKGKAVPNRANQERKDATLGAPPAKKKRKT